jgi:uncharacterized protein
MNHQRRDAFWKRGSIGDDFSAVQIPALVIAGWADGYRNTPVKAVAGLGGASKALCGPWIHNYPHFAYPRPRADFHAEAIRWWDRWLRGVPNGADELPQQRAFISEAVRPAERERERGHWVARNLGGDDTTVRFHLSADHTLSSTPAYATELVVSTPETCGADAGVFFVASAATELPGDQGDDDAASLLFETAPLDHDVDVLGRTRLRVRIAIDQPQGNLIARLVDVHPDGASHRVSFGVLNLSHRNSNETPQAMEPGHFETIDMLLDDTGYRFLAGHRIRLALSTAYFPMVLPPPARVRATIVMGADSYLDIPAPTDLVDVEMPEPPDGLLPVYEQLTAGAADREIARSSDGRTVTTSITGDTGEVVHPTNRMIWREIHESLATITADDPLSFECKESLTVMRRRSGVETRAVATGRLTATATHWQVEAALTAYEDEQVVFERTWAREIERDHQ